MSDNVTLPADGTPIATDDVAGVQFQRVKLDAGGDGMSLPVTASNPLPVTLDAAALAALAAAATPTTQAVSGTVTANTGLSQPATDAQLRAVPLPVSGTVTVSNPTAAGLTDTQLRASAVPVSGPATDAQLRATALPVSGTFYQATQPISAAALPLPSGAATAANQATTNTSLALAATAANQATEITAFGALTETAPTTDTASSGLNGRLQRIAQRITSLIAQIPAALGRTTMAQSLSVAFASDQPMLSDGTTAANTLAGDSGQNMQLIAGSRKEVTFTTTTPSTFSTAFDVSNYVWVSLQMTSIGTSNVTTFQCSNDGTTWYSVALMPSSAVQSNCSTTANGLGVWSGSLPGRYFRLSYVFASGTVAGVIEFFSAPRSASTMGVTAAATAVGSGAAGAALAGNPIRTGLSPTTNNTYIAAGNLGVPISTTSGAQITRPYSIPEHDWQYAAASAGIVNTTDVALNAAGAAGIRNYVTSISVQNASATATEVVIKDGATVIWRCSLAANAPLTQIQFVTPLRGTAATAINAACITTGAAVYINAQGYQAQ